MLQERHSFAAYGMFGGPARDEILCTSMKHGLLDDMTPVVVSLGDSEDSDEELL